MTLTLELIQAQPECVNEKGTLCHTVYSITHTGWLADSADVLIAKPAKIALIVIVALLVRLLAHRAIKRLTRINDSGSRGVFRPLRERMGNGFLEGTMLVSERRIQRASAIGSILRSITSFTIVGIALVLILGELGIDLAPILASAGVVGLALGFGAQNLVKDFLSGIFMIFEDQYGLGDVVDVGEATGTIEEVGLRITRLRDVHGTVWYVRNGEITRIGNKSQGYAQAVLDMPVAHSADLDKAGRLIKETADIMWHEEDWNESIVDEPQFLGVEQINSEGIMLRLTAKTRPAEQWKVTRELRLRIKERLTAEGIPPPPAPGTSTSSNTP